MVATQLQLLGHVRHHKRLTDGLPAGNAKRRVPIGGVPVASFDERLARNFFHGPQHGLVADAAAAQVELKHHLLRRRMIGGHGVFLTGGSI